LITPEFGFADLRAAIELPTISPAAGKTDSTRVCDEDDLAVVVVELVVVVAPVPEPACARFGSATAAAKPTDATRRVAMSARRLTGQVGE
jgi:hypothetical protein